MIIVTLLVIEAVDQIVADFLVQFNTSNLGISLFIVIAIGYILGQIFLLKLMNSSSVTVKKRSKLISILHRAVSSVQYAMVANVILVIAQIIVFTQYSNLSLLFVTFISNFFAATLLVIFALRFVSWYRNKKDNLGILLFALAFLILAGSEVISGLGNEYKLTQIDAIITPNSPVVFTDYPEGSFFNVFYSAYYYIEYSSFILIVLASALLLYHYSKKANARKLILIIALPILGYSSTILDALNLYDTDTNEALFYFYIYSILIAISSGALFAIAFWVISMKLPESSIKTFLKITAYGFILLYISNHVSVNTAPYPPFGINALSLLPVSAYFVLFGLYSSALSLSQDITLRNQLRSMARNDQNLLSSIGTAEMENEVKRAVDELKDVADEQEKELAEKSGIETPVPETEIEDYLKQVIEEVAKTRKKT
jgi:hypothetical protein